jgi:hypothetical protein
MVPLPDSTFGVIPLQGFTVPRFPKLPAAFRMFQIPASGIEYDAFPLPVVTRCQQPASFPAVWMIRHRI